MELAIREGIKMSTESALRVLQSHGLETIEARGEAAARLAEAIGSVSTTEATGKPATALQQAAAILKDEHPANMLTLRGIAKRPPMPTFEEVYQLRAGAIAVYPMYKGLAQLVGMDIVGDAKTLDDQMDVLRQSWNDYDFFFVHFKYTDSTGEDGNYADKVKRTEEFDSVFPRVNALNPTVLIVTGDHSTPAAIAGWLPGATRRWRAPPS